MRKEYRIIYYKDKRYNMFERYVIVGGPYIEALKEIKALKESDFAAEVSDYHTISYNYVMDLNHKISLKPMYRDLSKREFWS